MHLQLLSSIHSRCLSYPSSLSSCWCIHGVQIVVTIRCKYIWITLASSYCRITLEKPQKLAAMDCIVYEWSNKQTSKQTQSVLAGAAPSRFTSSNSCIFSDAHVMACSCYICICDEMRILMMLHQQTLTHHPAPKSERRMNQLAGTINLPQI